MDDSLCAAALLRRASAVRFGGGCIYYQYSAWGLLGWRALAARLLVGSLRRPCPGSCPGPAPDTDDCSVVDDIRLYQLLFSSPRRHLVSCALPSFVVRLSTLVASKSWGCALLGTALAARAVPATASMMAQPLSQGPLVPFR